MTSSLLSGDLVQIIIWLAPTTGNRLLQLAAEDAARPSPEGRQAWLWQLEKFVALFPVQSQWRAAGARALAESQGLRRRTPDQVRIMVAKVLQAGAEIAQCLIDGDDRITVRIRADLSTVGTHPVPLGVEVAKDGLGPLDVAVKQLNAALPLAANDTEVFERHGGKTDTRRRTPSMTALHSNG